MSRLDLVIFGATGFTGKHAVQELVRIAKEYPGLTWAVAGRSQSKLEDILKEASDKTGQDVTSVKKIIADVSDDDSLRVMCEGARVVVNCCGPYRLYGEPVVRAAVKAKAHYVDVSGEPQFIETMQLKYDQEARDAGVYIVNACGFDSIPTDMGVIFLQQNFGGTLNSVEMYLQASVEPGFTEQIKSRGVINYGTWESLVYGVSHLNDLKPLRKKIYPEPLPPFKPKLKQRSVIHKRDDGWSLPFPGADSSIVYRTQRHFYTTSHARPVQIKTYVTFPSFLMTLTVAFLAVVIFLLSRTSFTRSFLLKYPRFFSLGAISKDGPADEVMENSKFQVTLYGSGWEKGTDTDSPPNKKMSAKVSGVNPGYGATVVALLFAALTVLKEQDNLPAPGVLTTGVAFRNTNIIKHLHEHNLKFEIINQ